MYICILFTKPEVHKTPIILQKRTQRQLQAYTLNQKIQEEKKHQLQSKSPVGKVKY